jgi:mannose-6-phosphate isomerase
MCSTRSGDIIAHSPCYESRVKRLTNVIQPYAWGSTTAIAALRGVPATGKPEAELWLGAHPGGSSRVDNHGEAQTLTELIASDPQHQLGEKVVARLGPELPFLLKVLAASTPLSLQTHPSLAQAKEGFAREEALGIPRDAPNRNYKDANHKPELLCALTPFEALCGFREPRETLALFDELPVPALESLIEPLRRQTNADGVREVFQRLMSVPRETHRDLVNAVTTASQQKNTESSRFSRDLFWAAKLAELYPGDPGVIGALMLNCIQLKPLEAVYLSAGNLHAYLEGVGVEIMASSDNVLRGGCTPKYVDPAELLRVLDFRCGPVPVVRAEAGPDGEQIYRTPTESFRLSRLVVASNAVSPARRGAEILLVTEGEVSLESAGETLALRSGDSAYVNASEPPYRLSGHGTVFRATAGL